MVSPVLYIRDGFLSLFSCSSRSFLNSSFGRLRTTPITGSIAFTRHQTVIHKITTQCSRIQMEPPQDGVDFLLGVVRIERERVHDEVQDDEYFVTLQGNLLKGAVRVEEVFQDLADIFGLLLRFERRALALELP